MLYAFGSNGSAQLGVGHTEDLSSPQAISVGNIEQNIKVKQFAAGGNHTVLLCEDGRVLVTGNNEDGRCGIEGAKSLKCFESLDTPRDSHGRELSVEHVSANWSVTTLVCSDGSVWTCGTGNSGELGLGAGVMNGSKLQRIPSFPPCGTHVVGLSAGMAHTIAVLSDGEIYGWGKGRKGQIGEPAMDVWAPRKIEGLNFAATTAVCGKDFSFVCGEPSSITMTLLGAKGADRFGIRGGIPAKLPQWQNIVASWGSIFVLSEMGDVVSWGRNDHGQLPMAGIPAMKAIAAGSEHCLGVTEDGKVLAWGWGEHGNCGKPTDKHGDVKSGWNEIRVAGRAVGTLAGCATSFIETEHEIE
jgi:protein ATS1